MCICERKRLKKLLAAGDDLVLAIEKANWGTISHATLHMTLAMSNWREVCLLLMKKVD